MSAQDLNELFDVVDENDRVVGRETRGNVHAKKLFHRAVHLFVFNKKNEMLVQKRSREKDLCPGKFSTACAGHVDAGETYDSAVVREAKEELDLTLAAGTFFCIGGQRPSEDNGFEFVKIYVFRADDKEDFSHFNREEIESLHWFAADSLFKKTAAFPQQFAQSFVSIVNEFFRKKSVPADDGGKTAESARGKPLFVLEIPRLGGKGVLKIPVVASPKSRRMTLKFVRGQFCVSVAGKLKISDETRTAIELFVTKNRAWMEKQMAASGGVFVFRPAGTLVGFLKNNPRLELPLDGRECVRRVEIVPAPYKPFFLLGENDETLVLGVRGGFENRDAETLLRQIAGKVLEPQIRRLAAQTGVSVCQVKIKDTKKQWGSCTSAGNISLSWKLLLVPATARDHVLLHELCHRRVMNHSARFWEQLRRWDPQAAANDRLVSRFGVMLSL